MRRCLLTLLLLCASPAQAQVPVGDGRSVDLVYTTANLKFTVIDMGGKTQDLQVKETATEIRIEACGRCAVRFRQGDDQAGGGKRIAQRRRNHQGQGQRAQLAH